MSASLPLRLWANPEVERVGAAGRGFCLDVPADGIALALDGRGVAALVCQRSTASHHTRRTLLPLPGTNATGFLTVAYRCTCCTLATSSSLPDSFPW